MNNTNEVQHHDIFGVPITVNDYVLMPVRGGFRSRLAVGKVVKINPKTVGVVEVLDNPNERTSVIYSYELFVVTDNPGLTLHLLKNEPKRRR